MFKKSIEHLNANKMTYWQHLYFAGVHGFRCIFAGILLCVHSVIPALFPKTGSVLVNELNKSFTEHNDYLHLKARVEAFSKMVYVSDKDKDLTRNCR